MCDDGPSPKKNRFWSVFVPGANRDASEEVQDLLLSARVLLAITITVSLIWFINSRTQEDNKAEEYSVFIQSLPLMLIAGLFGLIGATIRQITSSDERITKRDFRNMVSGGLAGASAFLFVKSQILVNFFYSNALAQSGDTEPPTLEIDPFGTFFIALISGMFSPEIVGYARSKLPNK